jgi:hypothetical protein
MTIIMASFETRAAVADGGGALRGGGFNTVGAGAGDDVLRVSGGFNTIGAGAADDTLRVFGGFNTVGAGAAEDTLRISGGFNTVGAGAGPDHLAAVDVLPGTTLWGDGYLFG